MLRLYQLCKSFGAIEAVRELSFEVQEGELFGLLGPNGAGKTTTVNLAVGLLRPDRGRVELAGHGPPTDPAVRRLIGVAPQALALYEELTGRENLAFFARLYGLAGAELRRRIDWALDFVELRERAKDRVATYSGGMKRRLNLAIALIHQPRLLLLDEPTVGVDPQSRSAIFERIEELNRDGCTIIYTTHYMEEAQRLCDRVAIMDHGRLLALDSVEALIRRYGGRSVLRVEYADGRSEQIETDDALAELTRRLEQDSVQRFQLQQPDLERVFLNLTGRALRD